MERFKDAALKFDFFGNKYIIEKMDSFAVRKRSKKSESTASFSGELFFDMEKEFYGKPYLIKFKENLYLLPNSLLKLFLKLPLVKGKNGFFTNKVYILVMTSNEFEVEYGPKTSTKVIDPKTIIDRKISVAKTVLTRFDKFGISRELGL